MRNKRTRLLFLAAVLIAITTAGCSDDSNDSPKIRFGCALSLSGSRSATGLLYQEGYDLWESLINSRGGLIIGAKTYEVEVVYYDDESDVQMTGQLVERLINEDQVHFILGPYGSSSNVEAALMADQYGVPMVQGGGAAEDIFLLGSDYVFGLLNPAEDYFDSLISWAAGMDQAPDTVAIISADDIFSSDVARGALETAQYWGLSVISDTTFEEADELPAILSDLRDTDPDMVLFSAYFDDAVTFVQSAKYVGLNPAMFGLSVAPCDPAFLDQLGSDSEYIFGTAQWVPDLPNDCPVFGSAGNYAQLFEDEYGKAPEYHSAAASACGVSFQLALEEAGSVDRQAVRDALALLDVDTFYGTIRFGPDGRITGSPFVVVQIQSGDVIIIYPQELATGQAIYPAPAWDER
ncbi:MAG: amino acid ABC transporter substrate-binding protein [Thermodesulfobacteriota bacterium]|nr:amino acid ABC transporter substrate-binding protein [Thermodesulfobacteriota bacterium]